MLKKLEVEGVGGLTAPLFVTAVYLRLGRCILQILLRTLIENCYWIKKGWLLKYYACVKAAAL